MKPFLSVVIPAYNEAERIPRTLNEALSFLQENFPNDFEIIVVDDGSSDDTVKMVQSTVENETVLQLISFPRNRGKGAAVREGILQAKGKFILFMDADLATPMKECLKFIELAKTGVEVVLGSRDLPESDVRQSQSWIRQNMGRTFNRMVQLIVLHGIRDTQCGFKLFTKKAAKDIFSQTTVDRFAFDVEVLLLAKELGYKIEEVAVEWYHVPESRVSPIKDAAQMFFDIVKLRIKIKKRLKA